MGFRRRLEATVLGPGKPGQLRVTLGRGEHRFVTDVPVEILEPSLRMPNSQFVAVVDGRDVVRTEPAGQFWLLIQDQIRPVLNHEWDPIGVADIVEDEYDGYIDSIYALLRSDATEQAIADHLLWIEVERMELTGTPRDRLMRVAASLRNLQLPSQVNTGPKS